MVCIALCVAEAAAASIITRYLGVSDSVFGVWLGALNLIIFLMTIRLLDSKNIKFFFRKPLLLIGISLLLIYPLYYSNVVDTESKILGLDKLIFGFILGNISLGIGYLFNEYLIRKNDGKTYFKFQRSIVPISFPLLVSIILHMLGI